MFFIYEQHEDDEGYFEKCRKTETEIELNMSNYMFCNFQHKCVEYQRNIAKLELFKTCSSERCLGHY